MFTPLNLCPKIPPPPLKMLQLVTEQKPPDITPQDKNPQAKSPPDKTSQNKFCKW